MWQKAGKEFKFNGQKNYRQHFNQTITNLFWNSFFGSFFKSINSLTHETFLFHTFHETFQFIIKNFSLISSFFYAILIGKEILPFSCFLFFTSAFESPRIYKIFFMAKSFFSTNTQTRVLSQDIFLFNFFFIFLRTLILAALMCTIILFIYFIISLLLTRSLNLILHKNSLWIFFDR